MSSPVAAPPPPPHRDSLSTPTPTSVGSQPVTPAVTSALRTSSSQSNLPDYVQTLTVRDANGQVRELVFPKGLDLDRPKRARTTFTSDQLAALEREFRRNQYLVGRERSLLASRLGLSETQVKVWYQNRRTKHKRDREREHEAPTTVLAPSLASSGSLTPISRALLPSMQPSQTISTPLFTFTPTPTSTLASTTASIHAIPPKMCQATSDITPTPTVPVEVRSASLERCGADVSEDQESRNPATPPERKQPSPKLNRSLGGLEYSLGVGSMGGPMGGMTKAGLTSAAHALEMSFSKSIPSFLGSFHSVPPSVAPSAFRPLFQRPLHHPLALQHHALARPHPTWLP
ncbi:ventral anterior homeobox 1b-like [Macrobrachium rosenbergii]|uniref:ventral anterior homeobox 1b-like n=1 Tax=Macrobrachium rosenbergii TaxID=79674 RepID=UPI0034D64762